MSSLKKTRQAFGVTQPQLADYLSVTRSQVAMAETGQRSLPTAALVKLSSIEVILAGSTPALPASEMQKQSAAAKKMLATHAQKHERLAAAANRKLEAMRSLYAQHLKILHATSVLLAGLPAGKDAKKDKLWLELVYETSLKKINACGVGPQALLQLQADASSYHARQARALMV